MEPKNEEPRQNRSEIFGSDDDLGYYQAPKNENTERPTRDFGGDRKPYENRGDKPAFGDRKPYENRGDKPAFGSNDRPKRDYGDKNWDNKYGKNDERPTRPRKMDGDSWSFDRNGNNNQGYQPRNNDDRRPANETSRPSNDRKPFVKRYEDEDTGRFKTVFSPKQVKERNPNHEESTREDDGTVRLNKYLALSGIGSRRSVDDLIKQGDVQVNGETIIEMGYRINPDTDKVTFKGKTMEPQTNKVYILMNKPKNVVTTTDDPQGRTTVMDILAAESEKSEARLFPVGRLDRNTTGLLLMTNDGDLAQKMAHPSYSIKKIYHVELDRNLTAKHLEEIAAGVTLEDGVAMVDAVSYLDGAGKNEIGIEIHIGRNRIVRRIFEHFGYTVEKLDRIYYGGLTKKDIKRGFWRHLNEQEVIMLKHFTGKPK